MELFKILPVILIVFISGCTAQVDKTRTPPTETQQQTPDQTNQETPTQQPTEQGTLQGDVISQEQPPPTTKEFTIEADDSGFYKDGQMISSIQTSNGDMVKITFQVRSQGVYYGGLDFRGCGQNSGGTVPGGSTIVQFTADSTCTITSYWPSSGVVKSNLQVIVS